MAALFFMIIFFMNLRVPLGYVLRLIIMTILRNMNTYS